MKRRAKLQPRQSLSDRVERYFAEHPSGEARDCAKALGLTSAQVYGARCNLKKRGISIDRSLADPLDEKDILAVTKVGVTKVERILKLLKQL